MSKRLRLLYVEWIDHHNDDNLDWKKVEDLRSEEIPEVVCRSVGWLVKDDGRYIRLVPHLDGTPGDHGFGAMNILKAAIVRRVTLR